MKRLIVQIYEIQDEEEVPPLITLGVDHVGTVIISPDQATWPPLRQVVSAVALGGKNSVIIPLFSDFTTIMAGLAYFQPHIVHFCDALSPFFPDFPQTMARAQLLRAYQGVIKAQFPALRIMRSLSIPPPGHGGREVVEHTQTIVNLFAPDTDYFLIDTLKRGTQPVAGFVGITGEVADWAIAREVVAASPLPVILAGGLGPDNVAEAIRFVRPAGVDSCTRTNAHNEEGKPIRFRKDRERVRLFVAEVRRMERLLREASLPARSL